MKLHKVQRWYIQKAVDYFARHHRADRSLDDIVRRVQKRFPVSAASEEFLRRARRLYEIERGEP